MFQLQDFDLRGVSVADGTKPQKVRNNSGAIPDFLNRLLESLKRIRSVAVDLFDCANIKVFSPYRPRLI